MSTDWGHIEQQLTRIKEQTLSIFDHSQTAEAQEDFDKFSKYLNYISDCLLISQKVWYPAVVSEDLDADQSDPLEDGESDDAALSN